MDMKNQDTGRSRRRSVNSRVSHLMNHGYLLLLLKRLEILTVFLNARIGTRCVGVEKPSPVELHCALLNTSGKRITDAVDHEEPKDNQAHRSTQRTRKNFSHLLQVGHPAHIKVFSLTENCHVRPPRHDTHPTRSGKHGRVFSR